MAEMSGEGTLQGGVADQWASLERRLRTPGVTLVVAPQGSGKTAFANRLARDKSVGRTIALHDYFIQDPDSLEKRIRRELGSGRPGDLVILDRLDSLRAPLDSNWLASLITQTWTENLHLLILTSKSIDGAEPSGYSARRSNEAVARSRLSTFTARLKALNAMRFNPLKSRAKMQRRCCRLFSPRPITCSLRRP
jgi:hypothetical protein